MVAGFANTAHPVLSRSIVFDQGINEMTATALRAEVLALAAADPKAPIFLFLGSPGGGLYESLAIYDTFQLIPNEIIAICSGKVMSGGILILLGCSMRLSTPNTTFMIHHGHTTLSGNVVQLKEQHMEIESLNDRMLDIIIKNTKINREQLKSWLVKDHYMNTTNAITHGLIHNEIDSLNQLILEPIEENPVEKIAPKDKKKVAKKAKKKVIKKK
jgi:ATP-dependent Clp protease protease subunit